MYSPDSDLASFTKSTKRLNLFLVLLAAISYASVNMIYIDVCTGNKIHKLSKSETDIMELKESQDLHLISVSDSISIGLRSNYRSLYLSSLSVLVFLTVALINTNDMSLLLHTTPYSLNKYPKFITFLAERLGLISGILTLAISIRSEGVYSHYFFAALYLYAGSILDLILFNPNLLVSLKLDLPRFLTLRRQLTLITVITSLVSVGVSIVISTSPPSRSSQFFQSLFSLTELILLSLDLWVKWDVSTVVHKYHDSIKTVKNIVTITQ